MWRIETFHRNERGAAAVEFALVVAALILSILFVMTVGLYLYLSEALDYATSKAARQIMIGAVQTAGTQQANFASTYLCPYLPGVFNCANVFVNIQSVTEAAQPGGYYAFANANQTALLVPTLSAAAMNYSLGTNSSTTPSYEYMQVLYPITFLPGFVTSLVGNGAVFNGSPAIVLMSTIAFRNEQY